MGVDFVAEGHLFVGIAAVLRFHPEQSGRLFRNPFIGPGPGADAADGHTFREPERGDFVFHARAAVPNLHILRERTGGELVGVRPVQVAHHQVLLIGRGANHGENTGLAQRRNFAGGGVYIRELRGGVVIEKVFVMRVCEQIFVGGRGAGVAQAFLRMWAFGDGGFGGGSSAAGRDEMDQEGLAVAEPFHGSATTRAAAPAAACADTVEGYTFHAMGLPGCGDAEPELNTVRRGV